MGSHILRFLPLLLIFLLATVPRDFPLLGSVFLPFMVVFVVSNALMPDASMYRAFGMNRKRAFAHASLSVVPAVLLVCALVLWWYPPGWAVVGVVSAVVTGLLSALTIDPREEKTLFGHSAEGVDLSSFGSFGWVTLWRKVVIGSVVAGLLHAIATIIAPVVPWQWLMATLNTIVPFAFWFWFAYMMVEAAVAWKAFGRARSDWVVNLVVAAFAGAVLFAATAVAGMGLASVSGVAPATFDFAWISRFTWATVPLTAAIALLTVSFGSSGTLLSFFATMFAWFPLRGMVTDGDSPQSFLWFALIFSAVLLLVAAFQFWRTLTGRASFRVARNDYLGTTTA